MFQKLYYKESLQFSKNLFQTIPTLVSVIKKVTQNDTSSFQETIIRNIYSVLSSNLYQIIVSNTIRQLIKNDAKKFQKNN